MDLTQSKLSKQEWQTTEIPVSEQEMSVLNLLMKGYYQPDIHINLNTSLATFMKIGEDQRSTLEPHLYETFFQPIMTLNPLPSCKVVSAKRSHGSTVIKKADAIRISNMRSNIDKNRGQIFEFVLLDLVTKLSDRSTAASSLYTLIQLQKSSIQHINPYVSDFVRSWIEHMSKHVSLMDIVVHAEDYIEKNRLLGKYADMTLFSHQKDLFRLFHQDYVEPTLVLYIAPTGTGKTLSPLGLAQGGRSVLFVCSARHVGLSLARAAVSVQKRVAFAYGCSSAEDIRLHNFAAVDYMINKRSGAIAKVDNTNGSKVEIMICDVRSYLIAMNYMLEFHPEDQLVLYWDEPTITMDYDEHPLHPIIHRNWTENKISRIVLSCATLPNESEIHTTLEDYRLRFPNSRVKPIVSYDFKKSISLLRSDGKCVLPHLLFPDFRNLLECLEHIKANKTLLRYMDLGEISRFLQTVAKAEDINRFFDSKIGNITMTTLKLYYLKCLEEMDEDEWPNFHTFFQESLQGKFEDGKMASGKPISKSRSLDSSLMGGQSIQRLKSMPELNNSMNSTNNSTNIPVTNKAPSLNGVRLSTEDAWTLTDGPTIYIVENIENMALFFLKQTSIPKFETDEIVRKIQQNSLVNRRIEALEREIEDKKGKDGLKEKKIERDLFSKEVRGLESDLSRFKEQIETVRLRLDYLPNTPEHQQRFKRNQPNAFQPKIEESDVERIMQLDVDMNKKVLLLLGIGVFQLGQPVPYLELMKEMAQEQKLYLILASSDYIYGTNYAFCHGFISKDLVGMTQQKTIQAMGRIGRNLVQQDYTVRFRNDDLIRGLFLPVGGINKEAETMCRLFSSE